MKTWDEIKKYVRLDLILMFLVIFAIVRILFLLGSEEGGLPDGDTVLLVGDVTAVGGDVRIWREGREEPASKGMEIITGDSLITGPDGLVTVRLPDGSSARVSEHSACYFKRISPVRPELDIRVGQLRLERTVWPWLLNGPKGSIQTGKNLQTDGDATSLGLVMRVGRRVSIAVYEGMATWKTDGRSVEIPAGKAAILRRTDEVPTTVDLPQPPVITAPGNGSTYTSGLLRAGIPMTWEVTPSTEFYRVEIRRIDDTTAFSTRYETVREKQHLLRNLGRGTYTLRVLSSDDFGLESDWSALHMMLVAGRIFDIPDEPGTSARLSFRSVRQGGQFVIGGRVHGIDPAKHAVLVYQLDGQWNLANWDADFRVPIESDGYFESAVPEAAKVAIAVVDRTASGLPASIPYGNFPPAKDRRFLLSGVYRLN